MYMKLFRILLLNLVFITLLSAGVPEGHDISLGTGDVLRVQVVAPSIFRLRLDKNGWFDLSSMEKYRIVRHEWPSVKTSIQKLKDTILFSTEAAVLEVSKKDGAFILKNKKGQKLSSGRPMPDNRSGSFGVSMNLENKERIYGLGDANRDNIQRRGLATQIWAAYGPSYAPSPFAMSTAGYGIFVNSTWRHYWDIGKTVNDQMIVWGPAGDLDFYLIAGEGLPDVLSKYTDITGKPTMLPLKSYGLMYIEHYKVTEYDVLRTADKFRELQIPCDWLGLEPGWMATDYDRTTEKNWHPDRFFMPFWGDLKGHKEETFIGALGRMGFDLELWMNCNYDISWEADRRALKTSETKGSEAFAVESAPFELDPLNFDVRGHTPWMMDSETKPGEAWFEHLKKFVDQGVAGFKQDPAFGINEHPDRFYSNGMTDEEMHNLYQTLLAQQYHEGYREYTGGKRSMGFVCAGYAGLQHWAPTWAGDSGGGVGPLISMLNQGLSGHMNVTCDMEVVTPAGIHFGFLQGWAQVNGWAKIRHPWRLEEKQKKMFIDYDRLRYQLMPYIYSTAFNGHLTGMPIMRAMPLHFPNDRECENLTNQYMFGPFLLTAAFTNKLYLPDGQWIDYWTGKNFAGGRTIDYTIPNDRGGALFIKSGAILPQWPPVNYADEKIIREITLDIYPDGQSEFTLFEDDGGSYDYEKGDYAFTKIACSREENQITLQIDPRQGDYHGKPAERTYDLKIHRIKPPVSVQVGEEKGKWQFDDDVQVLSMRAEENVDSKKGILIQIRF